MDIVVKRALMEKVNVNLGLIREYKENIRVYSEERDIIEKTIKSNEEEIIKVKNDNKAIEATLNQGGLS